MDDQHLDHARRAADDLDRVAVFERGSPMARAVAVASSMLRQLADEIARLNAEAGSRADPPRPES